MPPTKTSRLLELIRTGDWPRALSLAATFRMLSCEVLLAIRRGHAARMNPRLYAQLGQEPDALVEAGKAALHAHYGDRLL
jgi:hypothetical protein